MNSRSPSHALTAITAVMLVGVVAAYAGLIPLGHWEDEFQTFPLFVEHGWKAWWFRTIQWSPRPVSETILFAYARLAMRAGDPLIPQMLTLLWLLLASSALVVPLAFRSRFPSQPEWRRTMLLALGLFCLFLVGHPVAEFFYWPQSAVAYIPALAGLVLAMWLLVVRGLETSGVRRAVAASLSIAALSAEVAAIFVLILCSLAVFVAAIARVRQSPGEMWQRFLRTLPWPFLSAATVMGLAAFARVGNKGEVFGDPALAHHFLPAVAAAAVSFVRELLSLHPERHSWGSLAIGIAAKSSFFVATLLMLRPFGSAGGAPKKHAGLLALFALACLGTIFATIWAAYYQFGVVCCQRHGTFRQALAYVFIFSLGAAAAFSRPAGPSSGVATRLRPDGSAWLLVAILLPALASVRALAHDYRTFEERWQAARRNWQAGHAGGDRFVYSTVDPGQVVGGLGIPDGTYAADSRAPGSVPDIVRFFDKKEITFRNHADRTPQALLRPPFDAPIADQPPPQCHVDLVNGQLHAAGAAAQRRPDGSLTLQGWTAPHGSIAASRVRTWLVVNSPAGTRRYYQAPPEQRRDVADALRRPELIDAGFRITLEAGQVQQDSTIEFLSVSGQSAYRCNISLKAR